DPLLICKPSESLHVLLWVKTARGIIRVADKNRPCLGVYGALDSGHVNIEAGSQIEEDRLPTISCDCGFVLAVGGNGDNYFAIAEIGMLYLWLIAHSTSPPCSSASPDALVNCRLL